MAKTILIVTTEDTSVESHAHTLEEYGYQSIIVHNEDDAIDLLDKEPVTVSYQRMPSSSI